MGFEVIVADIEDAANHDTFGVLIQYPATTGSIADHTDWIDACHDRGTLVAVAADLLSLVLLKPPGEMGADVVVGSAQRFGVPPGFGGPHAAFFATRDEYKRSTPGRVIGVTRDARGNTALRMAMQTREQHIRRDRATSNICTAQALLANMAAFYCVYHGPARLQTIASRVHALTQLLASGLDELGFPPVSMHFFDTLLIETNQAEEIIQRAADRQINFRCDIEGHIGISLDETTKLDDVFDLIDVFANRDDGDDCELTGDEKFAGAIPESLERQSDFLTHEVFHRYHSETEMLRYLKRLENRDYSLTHGMIPLGSCTMKLNATAEMIPVTWPGVGQPHPFAPPAQVAGYRDMIAELQQWLITITGYDAMSMQPNSGAQGEYAGLLAIRRYHESLGQGNRNVCLIPQSAHGTNPASASMMGLDVVVVGTDEAGNIDMDDLTAKADQHRDRLSSLMITWPSTHGVFERTVSDACQIVHDRGGQVYLDGANMNALVGIVAPGKIGADVSHLNLHKTFCIPHGGGGPGMGPIGVKSHLAPFLPGHVLGDNESTQPNDAVSSAPFGSASILPISWMFIRMMGGSGLKQATQVAILSANYIARRLDDAFPVLYKGPNGRVAHECIIDIRAIKEATGITEVDIAKRLMDYGFHAPTMSWPVAGTMMIEPTESESKQELDRFCDALLSIRAEIAAVERGEISAADTPLKHAPHTLADIFDAQWERAYDRQTAARPVSGGVDKFWPTVNRVDDVFGDRNVNCSCPPMSDYES